MKILAIHGVGESKGFSRKLRDRVQEARSGIIWDELFWSSSFVDQVNWFNNTVYSSHAGNSRLAELFHYMHPRLGHEVRMEFWKNSIDADIIIGYSAGSVVAFDALTRWQTAPTTGRRVPDSKLVLVTMGSPLALYAVSAGNLPDPNVVYWMNIYDARDPVSSPLAPVWGQENVDDVRVRTGGVLTAHLHYWDSKEVFEKVLSVVDFAAAIYQP